ncbi:hypothetical protein [Paenarthrobacter nicotinovorans]|uniref:hypothetical protein n=1 Tax=Paenarthrobacter nicotinovorans TaxID=29320 RepID=UPI0011A23CD1|nr:hypothetical protein [Paenarthrobacter nicotinovorans]
MRNAFFKFFTGREGDTSGRADGDLKAQLVAAYGTNKRGGVDTAKAAKSLGVSQRAVNYWLQGRYKPNTDHRKTIATKSRQAATTKRGRQRLADFARKQPAAKNKAPQIYVMGLQGPRNAQNEYLRHRITNLWQNLSQNDINDFIDVWAEGGEDAALDWLQNAFSTGYLDEWGFKSIDSISFQDPRL